MQNDELRHTQIELAAAREAFVELYEHAPVSYFTKSKVGVILQVNRAGAKLLGAPKQRLSGLPWTRFIAPESQDQYYLFRNAEMAAGIAHEINNPLSIIVGRATQMRRLLTLAEPKDVNQMKCVESILETAMGIAEVVRGMAAFSRAGDEDPACPVRAQKIASTVFEICRDRFRLHRIELISDEIPPVDFEGREMQVVQVMLNLFNNSFDAVENSSERWVRLTTRLVGTDAVEFAVTDSGPKIPAEIAVKLMNAFFTTKPAGKGTGLGLSISRSLAEKNGGRLEYDRSSPHTRFVLTLPARRSIR